MTAEYYSGIVERIFEFKYLGTKTLDDGTVLVGKVPHIAPYAWLHAIFPPLNLKDVEKLELEIGYPIAPDYRQFLLSGGNGITVFSDTLTLYGLRKKDGRTLDAAWQPFSLVTPNTRERPKNLSKQFLLIGGYGYDASKLVMDSIDGKIHYCKRNSADFLETWDSLEELLLTETVRLAKLFDKQGKRIVDGLQTLPVH